MMANASANDLQLLTMPVNIFQNENNTTGGATTLTIPPPKMTINETNTSSSSSSSLPVVVETTTLDERWNSFTSANDLLTPINLFQDENTTGITPSLIAIPPKNITAMNQTNTTSFSIPVTEDDKYWWWMPVICFIILAPCLLACVFQSIYSIKKRRKDRIERQLQAVSSNPTSRMLILSEIFKNDIRPVTEDEAYSPRKKKRILVKKHRKRTPSERLGLSSGSISPLHGMMMGSGDEVVISDHPNVIIYDDHFASNRELNSRHDNNNNDDELNDIEDQMNSTWSNEDEVSSTSSNDSGAKPFIVYISDRITMGGSSLSFEHGVIPSSEENNQLDEHDNVSTLDGEDAISDRSFQHHERDEYDDIESGGGVHGGDSLACNAKGKSELVNDTIASSLLINTTMAAMHDREEPISHTESDPSVKKYDTPRSSPKSETSQVVLLGSETPITSANELNATPSPTSPRKSNARMTPAGRVAKEVAKLCKPDSSSGIVAHIVDDDMNHLIGTITGPLGTPYEGGVFNVNIVIPTGYPFEPPKMKFITRIWHPNISSQTGAICLDILKDQWSPALNIKTAMLSLQALLCSPEPDNPQDAVVATMYLNERAEFDKTAKYWVQLHATSRIEKEEEGGEEEETMDRNCDEIKYEASLSRSCDTLESHNSCVLSPASTKSQDNLDLIYPPAIPFLRTGPISSGNYLSPRVLSPISDRSNNCDNEEADDHCPVMPPLFRETNLDYDDSPGLVTCGSDVTEITSNVLDGKDTGDLTASTVFGQPSSSYHHLSKLNCSDESDQEDVEVGVIPMEKVESCKSTDRSLSDTVSYFSYEDVSITSDDCEMCSICLCAYDEGDVRIFSKRCPHAFHKECILEWLVKSQQCPCCRIDMVTKEEMYEISKTLIGTERLAQAMAGSQMQEGTPFRSRVRQSQLVREMQRLRSRIDMPSTPFATRTSEDDANTQAYNMNWNWTTRFVISTDQLDEQPREINSSRSSEALTSPNPMSSDADGSLVTPNDTIFHHHWAQQPRELTPITRLDPDGSIFHDHWQSPRQVSPTRRSSHPINLGTPTIHNHWRESSPTTRNQPQLPPRLSTAHTYWREHSTDTPNQQAIASIEELRAHTSLLPSIGIARPPALSSSSSSSLESSFRGRSDEEIILVPSL
jgi:ubiquitin-conjugating enzyme (huntingtin interacting protein 2)